MPLRPSISALLLSLPFLPSPTSPPRLPLPRFIASRLRASRPFPTVSALAFFPSLPYGLRPPSALPLSLSPPGFPAPPILRPPLSAPTEAAHVRRTPPPPFPLFPSRAPLPRASFSRAGRTPDRPDRLLFIHRFVARPPSPRLSDRLELARAILFVSAPPKRIVFFISSFCFAGAGRHGRKSGTGGRRRPPAARASRGRRRPVPDDPPLSARDDPSLARSVPPLFSFPFLTCPISPEPPFSPHLLPPHRKNSFGPGVSGAQCRAGPRPVMPRTRGGRRAVAERERLGVEPRGVCERGESSAYRRRKRERSALFHSRARCEETRGKVARCIRAFERERGGGGGRCGCGAKEPQRKRRGSPDRETREVTRKKTAAGRKRQRGWKAPGGERGEKCEGASETVRASDAVKGCASRSRRCDGVREGGKRGRRDRE